MQQALVHVTVYSIPLLLDKVKKTLIFIAYKFWAIQGRNMDELNQMDQLFQYFQINYPLDVSIQVGMQQMRMPWLIKQMINLHACIESR